MNSAQTAREPQTPCPMLSQEAAFCACLLFCPPGTWTLLGAHYLVHTQGCMAWLGAVFNSASALYPASEPKDVLGVLATLSYLTCTQPFYKPEAEARTKVTLLER